MYINAMLTLAFLVSMVVVLEIFRANRKHW